MKITIDMNLTEFRSQLKTKIRALNKSKIRTSKQAANLVVLHAKRLAPRHSGATINGIISKKISRFGYRAISEVPGDFKQNLWANQKAPFKKPKMRWNKFQPTLYGQGPANYTGTPRFFDRAVQLVQKKYKKIAVRNTKSALKTGTR